MTFKRIDNIAQIKDDYDLFLVDLWGVIHDGESLYDGVKECLEQLKAHDKKVIFISNAPKRVHIAQKGLDNLDISEDLYHELITSGELTFDYISSNEHGLGQKYYLINEQEIDLLEGSGYERVKDPQDADFVVTIGFRRPDSKLEELMPTLYNCIDNGLHMVCANPDLVTITKAGVHSLCAGVMAEKYHEMGGDITYFGKPFDHIYQAALSRFKDTPKERVAAIGDNIRTDIEGANQSGIDSYLIAGGIHRKELDTQHGNLPDQNMAEQFFNTYKTEPTGVLSAFVW